MRRRSYRAVLIMTLASLTQSSCGESGSAQKRANSEKKTVEKARTIHQVLTEVFGDTNVHFNLPYKLPLFALSQVIVSKIRICLYSALGAF